MAALPEGAEFVVNAILEMESTENSRVHKDLLAAASALPAALAARLVSHATEWVSGPQSDFLSDAAGDLIVKLASGGEVGAALELARAALALRAEKPVETATEDGETFRFPPRLRAHFESWAYGRLVSKIWPALTNAGGVQALELFCDCLGEAVDLSSIERDDGPDDGSFIWRPAIESHEQNRTNDFKGTLVEAVRDIAEELIRGNAELVSTIVDLLEQKQWRVFHRIALYLIGACEETPVELVASRSTSREIFDDPSVRHEYTLLLEKRFGSLTEDVQEVILTWIKAGPDLESDEEAFVALHGRASTDEERASRKAYWQRDRLAPIASDLPDDLKERYGELVVALGGAKPGGFAFRSGTSWVGPTSPKSSAELSSMTVEDLVHFLTVWEPPREPTSPSPEGLERILQAVIAENPATYADAADQFHGLDPTYVRGVLSGFDEAVKEGRPFSWQQVVTLMRWVVEKQDEPRDQPDSWDGQDPHWGWAMKQVASLLARGFEAGPSAIPYSLRGDVWSILARVSRDPDPTPEHEEKYGGDNMDPATLSINTTRGTAMHAVVKHALWVRRNDESLEDAVQRIAQGFGRMPEVVEVLEEHLDIGAEPSLAVRAVYGQWFPWLVLLDPEWAESNASSVFPSAEEEPEYLRAAWETYLRFCAPYDNVLMVLRPQYHEAAVRLADRPARGDGEAHPILSPPSPHTEAEARFAEHLVEFYWRGRLEILGPDGVLAAFYTQAPVSLRTHLLEHVGRSLLNSPELVEEVADRLKALWEWRVAAARDNRDADDKEELAAFGWWFSSGLFEADWSFDQLDAALDIAGNVDHERSVAEKLAELAGDKPLEVMRLFHRLVRANTRGWGIDTWKEFLSAALDTVYETNDASAKDAARELVNELGSLGYFEFRAFLE